MFEKITRLFSKKDIPPPFYAMLTYLGSNPLWTDKNIKALTKEGFMNCMTVFACVSLIAKGGAGIPWILTKIAKGQNGKTEEIYDHPLLQLIRRPNPRQGQSAFIEAALSFYLIAGNNYMLATGPEKAPAKELYNLMPHLIKIKSGNQARPIEYYKYDADPSNPINYPPERVLHLRAFHPLDDFYGLSSLEVAAKGIDIVNMGMQWNYNLLKNDMRPPGGFIIEQPLQSETRKLMLKDMKEKYSGYEHAGEPLLLEGVKDWKPFAITPRDSDWLNSDKLNMRKICVTLNVDPSLIGDTESKTYSNRQDARKALYTEAILPLMDFYRDELNNWLTPQYDDNLKLDYDRDEIEALREEMTAVYSRMSQSYWLTVNEKRAACGYDEIGPEGEALYIPMMLTPIKPTEGQKSREMKSNKRGSFWEIKENKAKLWAHFVKRVEAKEKPFQQLSEKFLREQAEKIKKKFSGFNRLADVDVNKVFDAEDETKRYSKEFEAQYMESLLHAGEAGLATTQGKLLDLGTELKQEEGFIITPEMKRKLDKLILESGAEINLATLKKIENMVIQAEKETWTVEELAQSLRDKLDDLSITRSRTIARTETAKVENWGQVEGYKQAEFIEKKGWLCSFVENSREAHMEADRKYSDNPIPLDEPFEVGGELMDFPGDPSHGASAGNLINCLCATFPVVGEI